MRYQYKEVKQSRECDEHVQDATKNNHKDVHCPC